MILLAHTINESADFFLYRKPSGYHFSEALTLKKGWGEPMPKNKHSLPRSWNSQRYRWRFECKRGDMNKQCGLLVKSFIYASGGEDFAFLNGKAWRKASDGDESTSQYLPLTVCLAEEWHLNWLGKQLPWTNRFSITFGSISTLRRKSYAQRAESQ